MTACYGLTVLGAIATILYLRERVKDHSLTAVFEKSLVSVLFVATAVCAWYASASGGRLSRMGIYVVSGLLFGLLGDIFLDLKYVFPQEDERFTLAGFAVFGVGHALYLTGMVVQFGQRGGAAYWRVPLLLGAAASLANVALEKPMRLSYGRMKGAVSAYGVMLFGLLLVSGSLALAQYRGSEPALNLLFAGGVLFALSDLILSGIYYGEGRDRPADIVANFVTYAAAQFLIAYSLLYL